MYGQNCYQEISVEDTQLRKAGRPKKQEKSPFVGFTQAVIQEACFLLPAIWVNVCAEIDNLAELKVVQYVLLHTWGYHDYECMEHITIDEFVNGRKSDTGERMDFGTGLSRTAVKDGLARAIEHGLLVCLVDARDKARIKKYYALHMQNEETDHIANG